MHRALLIIYRIGDRNAKHLVNQDDPNVIEIWNVVFIQFNREIDKSLRPLPNKHIDTGLGFERLVSILQNKSSNYDTDVFSALFEKIQEITKARPYQGHFGSNDVDGIDTAYRVVADHVRTCTIAISDGAIPDNAGQGYVVRRICRRGVRYGRKYFNAEVGSFLSKMVPTVVKELGYIFPEIQKKEQEVKEILDQEEQAFALTLDRGEIMFNKHAQECQINSLKNLPGAHVWRLYDTFGFPIDLTKIMAEEQGLSVNDEEVCAAQDQARIASKGGKKSTSNSVAFDVHDIATLESMVDVPKTNDIAKYKEDVIESTIKALYHNGKFVKSTLEIPEGQQFAILLDETNFYAESGGQESDTGRFIIDGVAEMTVRHVQSYRGYVLHTGYMEYGSWSVNDRVFASHDGSRRQSLRMNHTGTHILNFALREVLGREVEQKGSLVAPNKLRFDFSHRIGLTENELKNITDISEKYIQDDKEVFTFSVSLSIAKQIQGVRAIPGETYPDPVRVVSIGKPVHELVANVAGENGFEKESWKYSVELCGGTHVARTSELQKVVIVEECAVAKGVRRIVAITGAEALEAQRATKHFEEERLARLEQLPCTTEKEALFKETQAALSKLVISTSSKNVFTKRLEKIGKDILKEQKEAQKAQVDAAIDFIKPHFEQHQASTSFVAQLPTDLCAKAVFESIKIASAKYSDKSIYFIGVDHVAKKVAHGCFVSPEHTSKGLVACKWTEQVAGIVGGKAGGKESTSVGTGNDVSRVQEGVEAAVKALEDLNI